MTLREIIETEKPDSLLPNMGGQAGLNLGMELAESGFLDSHHVTLLGTTAETIRNAEGRQEFKDMMERIGEPCAPSLFPDFPLIISILKVFFPVQTGSGRNVCPCSARFLLH